MDRSALNGWPFSSSSLKTDKNPVVFKCRMVGGHGGASGRYDGLKEVAYTTAFILDQMGVRE